MTMPLGVAYHSKLVRLDDNQLKLQIWDTVGQERFNAISQMYYRRAKIAIVCVDVTDLE
ncbi:small guanosine triphosphatase family (GTPase)-like Ras family protein, partial [Leptotrombidium deliense]